MPSSLNTRYHNQVLLLLAGIFTSKTTTFLHINSEHSLSLKSCIPYSQVLRAKSTQRLKTFQALLLKN